MSYLDSNPVAVFTRMFVHPHGEIIEEDGQYYIKTLASNQVSLKRTDMQEHTVREQEKLYPLYHGDTMSLDYSQIALMFFGT